MNTRMYVFFVLAVLLMIPSLSYGAGGGGGGYGVYCSEDTWQCTEWSACSSSGMQTRTCSLSFDCPTATQPLRPPQEQSCTHPPAPVVLPTPSPAVNQPVFAPPRPGDSQLVDTCDAEVINCTDWSSQCVDGRERRTCTATVDCPKIKTELPSQERPCQKLQCGNKATLRERVSCRLSLTPASLAREYQISYLPEECRAVPIGTRRDTCIKLYTSFQTCWAMEGGDERVACARRILNLGNVISDEVKTCQGKTGQEQVACKQGLRDRVFALIKFRFYELEERAEELLERGADRAVVSDFVAIVEQKKQDFNTATDAQRRQIILDVRSAWQSFLKNVALPKT